MLHQEETKQTIFPHAANVSAHYITAPALPAEAALRHTIQTQTRGDRPDPDFRLTRRMNKEQNITTKWMNGIAYEVAFWNNVYRWKWTFNGMMNWSKHGGVITLEGFDANAFLAKTDKPKVLDVGCGMSYATGNHIMRDGQLTPLDIHYVDPLAGYFNRILARHRRKLPRIEFGMAEYLSAFYPAHDVSLVIIQNALDHSAHPMKSIYESIDVLKKGGCLYLNHHINEAETEHYKGFHQYNICRENGKLIIWNKNERHDVAELTAGFAELTVGLTENGHVAAVIRKTGDVPQSLIDDKGDKRALCSILMDYARTAGSPWHGVKNSAAYWKYNILQFFIQGLPWTLKMKLKKLIKQA